MVKWHDARPPYLRYAAELRAEIMSGDLTGKLPSVKSLMDRYETGSTSVIQRAITVLRDEGFVDTQHGRGNFVRTAQVSAINATPYVDPKTSRMSYKLVEVVAEAKAPADVRRALGIGDGDVAVLRKQIGIRDGETPVELIWNFYLTGIASGTAIARRALIDGGVKALLSRNGHVQREMIDVETTRAPTQEEVEALELPDGVPVLRVLRSITDAAGMPIEVSVIVKGGHLYALRHHSELH